MKITREIDGKKYEFTLDFNEHWNAWHEWQDKIYREDVEMYIERYLEFDEERCLGDDEDRMTAEAIEPYIDDIVEKYTDYLNYHENNYTERVLEQVFDWVLR